MKKYVAGLILLILLFAGCKKTEINQIDLKGTLKGEIYAMDEIGQKNNDNRNILVQLEGSEPLLKAVTDSAGKYEIRDIPSGTYNLVLSKEGYGEYQKQGFQIVGGSKPRYFFSSIIKKSSTTVEDLSLEIVNETDIYLKCIVNHDFDTTESNFRTPVIRYFINTTGNPSNKNYLLTNVVPFEGESGTQLYARVPINNSLFPSGSTIYIIAYGCNNVNRVSISYYAYYDILLNQFIDTTVGEASNITSITIP